MATQHLRGPGRHGASVPLHLHLERREQAARGHLLRPPPQRAPAARLGPGVLPVIHQAAHLLHAQATQPKERQCQRDGRPREVLARHRGGRQHRPYRPAALALVAPARQHLRAGRLPRPGRPPLLALHQSVPVDAHSPALVRRLSTPPAPARPGLLHRGRPGLDLTSETNDSFLAPCSFSQIVVRSPARDVCKTSRATSSPALSARRWPHALELRPPGDVLYACWRGLTRTRGGGPPPEDPPPPSLIAGLADGILATAMGLSIILRAYPGPLLPHPACSATVSVAAQACPL